MGCPHPHSQSPSSGVINGASLMNDAALLYHEPRYPTLGPDHAAYTLIPLCASCHAKITSKQVRG